MRIVIGGETRKCGKTSLVCAILRAFPHVTWAAAKVTPHAHPPREGGDTGRYLAAGAAEARLFAGGVDELFGWLAGRKNWIVESTSLAPQIDSDARILVLAAPEERGRKPGVSDRFEPDCVMPPGLRQEDLERVLAFLRERWKEE